MTAPAAPTESRRARLSRLAAKDLAQLDRDGELPAVDPGMQHDRSSDRAESRRERLERWAAEREAEQRFDRSPAAAELEAALLAAHESPR